MATSQQIQVPAPPRGYGTSSAEVVVDAANVLDPATIAQLNRIAFDVHQKAGGEMAIVTLPDLRGRDVADIALQIGRQWGVGANAAIGSSKRNAGVVILVVPKETSSDGRGYVRIETGRGTEGFITDGQAGDIRREATPYFQRRDYDGALLLIARRVAERFASEFGFSLDTSVVPPEAPPSEPVTGPGGSSGIPPFFAFVVFIIILFALVSAAGRRRPGCGGCLSLLWLMQAAGGRRGGGWGGGGGGFGGGSFGGGGGFGGFGGGGGFSGGGSSGSW